MLRRRRKTGSPPWGAPLRRRNGRCPRRIGNVTRLSPGPYSDGEFGVRVKTGLSDGDRSIYLVTSFYSDPELPIGYARGEAPLGFVEPPKERTIEYDEEALRHFEGDL